MKWLIRFFLCLGVLTIVPRLYAQNLENEGKKEDSDMDALRQWIRDKRLVTVKELGGDLSISGEVRTEMQASNEEWDGVRQRGIGGATKRPTCAFDVEVNLMVDYRNDRTWSAIKLEFDNDMGLVTGTTNRLALERAVLGGRLVAGETFVLDSEIGRRNLNNVFDSKIEFCALFDGLLFKFNKAFEAIGNFYVNSGSFLVNDRKYHFGYITELGMLRIANTNLYLKYSIIDWKKHYNKRTKDLAFNFLNSQLILGFQGDIPKWKKFLRIYLAGLLNHLAERIELTKNKKANYGWYAGFSVGQIKKGGDWALDVNYQQVAAQAVPDFDSAGIRRGNAQNIGFYSVRNYGAGDPTTNKTAVGNENFKGWQIEFLYAITNNLTLFQNFQRSQNLDKAIGPFIKFFQYEIEFIYAF